LKDPTCGKWFSLAQSCGTDRDKRISPKVNFTDVVGSNML